MSGHRLSKRQRNILETIERHMTEHGYPPSVREIGDAVGLSSPSTVHSHLTTLQREGYLHRDPSKPRAIEVRWDPNLGAHGIERRPFRHVPLVGSVAAGTDVLAEQFIEETVPVPTDLCGDGELFMLKVRGDSMIEAGILNGDFVVAKVQQSARPGDIIVVGIPGEEATVKFYGKESTRKEMVLLPANSELSEMRFPTTDVEIFGKVVTVMRRV